MNVKEFLETKKDNYDYINLKVASEWLEEYASLKVAESKPSEWVSVSERLPEIGECVLLYSDESGVVEGAWTGVAEHFEQWRWSGTMQGVTDWMPLPNPPRPQR